MNKLIKCDCGCGKELLQYRNGYKRRMIKGHAQGYKGDRTQKVIKCACGCGIELNYLDKHRRIRKFILGHNSKNNMVHNFGKKTSIKVRLKQSIKRKELIRQGKVSSPFANKTYEEVLGVDRAKKLKEHLSNVHKEYLIKNPNELIRLKIERNKQIFPMTDTLIEVKIQNFLKELNIEFFTHQYIKEIRHRYQCDIFIPIQDRILQKTIIECDGDAFHFNPKFYNKDSRIFRNGMTAEQRWELDETRTKELIEQGFRIIRLWGSEIKIMDLNKFNEKLKI